MKTPFTFLAFAALVAVAQSAAAEAVGGSERPAPAPTITTAPAAEPTAAERDRARRHFDRALALANDAHYAEAIAEFSAAYELVPHFAVLYNLGQAYVALGRHAEAVAALEQYLADGGDQVEPDRVLRARQQILEQRAMVAELRIAVDAPGATVALDGQRIADAALGAPLLVTPGVHELTVTAPDGATQSRSVALELGQVLTVSFGFSPPPPVATPAPRPRPLEPALGPQGDPTRAPLPSAATVRADADERPPLASSATVRTIGFVLTGVGVGLGGATVAHYAWNRDRAERWRAEDEALTQERVAGDLGRRQRVNNELAASIDRAEPITVGLGIGAGLGLVGGGSLIAMHLRGGSVELAASTGAGSHLAVRGVW